MTKTDVYREHFAKSLQRGRSLGFTVPTLGPPTLTLAFDDPNDETILAVTKEVSKIFQHDDLIGRCLHVSSRIRKIVRSIVKAQPMFTIGSVTVLGKTTFEFTDADLQSWMKNGLPASAPVHAWLTLPTMEIVDFTFAYSLMHAASDELKQEPQPILGLTNSMSFTYTPLLVADNFMERVGAT